MAPRILTRWTTGGLLAACLALGAAAQEQKLPEIPPPGTPAESAPAQEPPESATPLPSDIPAEIDPPTESTPLRPRKPEPEAAEPRASKPIDEPAPIDAEVRRVQNPAPAAAAPASDAFDLVDRLPEGPQSVGVIVDVQGPNNANLNQEFTVAIVVQNTGQSDAHGVVVRDLLPNTVQFVSSDPKPEAAGQDLSWRIGTLPARTKRTIEMKVKAVARGSFDHVPTVVVMTGAKTKTNILQPMLRVEQTVTQKQVMKGQVVEFNITVSNPGDGVARNVVVKAAITSGLQSRDDPSASTFQQTIPELRPKETVRLEPFTVNTIGIGKQNCTVTATSPDVPETTVDPADAPAAEGTSPEWRSLADLEVIAPDLKLKLIGPSDRPKGALATYTMVVENAGTAAAQDVNVVAFPRAGGDPVSSNNTDFTYDREKRQLYWQVRRLDPGEKREFPFQLRLSSIQKYVLHAAANAKDIKDPIRDSLTTDVTGLADVQFEKAMKRNTQVVDVGDKTEFEIHFKNYGSLDATNLQIACLVSENIKVIETEGTEQSARQNPTNPNQFVFTIDRLAPGDEQRVLVRVEATKPGLATCLTSLRWDDLPSEEAIQQKNFLRVAEAARNITK